MRAAIGSVTDAIAKMTQLRSVSAVSIFAARAVTTRTIPPARVRAEPQANQRSWRLRSADPRR